MRAARRPVASAPLLRLRGRLVGLSADPPLLRRSPRLLRAGSPVPAHNRAVAPRRHPGHRRPGRLLRCCLDASSPGRLLRRRQRSSPPAPPPVLGLRCLPERRPARAPAASPSAKRPRAPAPLRVAESTFACAPSALRPSPPLPSGQPPPGGTRVPPVRVLSVGCGAFGSCGAAGAG